MSLLLFFLICLSVTLSALAQIMLKHGMSAPLVQFALQQAWPTAAYAVVTNLYIVGGLALYALGAMVWLAVLARVDVSLAYPFVAVGFLLTMILAILMLGEAVSPTRMVGTVLIAVGALLVAKS